MRIMINKTIVLLCILSMGWSFNALCMDFSDLPEYSLLNNSAIQNETTPENLLAIVFSSTINQNRPVSVNKNNNKDKQNDIESKNTRLMAPIKENKKINVNNCLFDFRVNKTNNTDKEAKYCRNKQKNIFFIKNSDQTSYDNGNKVMKFTHLIPIRETKKSNKNKKSNAIPQKNIVAKKLYSKFIQENNN